MIISAKPLLRISLQGAAAKAAQKGNYEQIRNKEQRQQEGRREEAPSAAGGTGEKEGQGGSEEGQVI
jgi:hypothetical protein